MLWPLVWLYAPLRTRSRVLVVCDNEFLAIRAYFGSGSWQLPGGGVGHNESSKSAAVRELKEEVSIVLNDVVTLVPTSTYKECGLLMRYDLFLSVLKTKPKIAKNKEIFDATWLPISSSQQHYPSHIQSALTAYSRGNLLK